MQLDRTGGRLYLRLVYAGPIASGKTTTLRALLPAMGISDPAAVTRQPPNPRDGLAMFDWAEYEGGLYQDCRIRCQLVGVVGAEFLRDVRRALVEGADAVVFVADARRSRLEENRRSLAELRSWLEQPGSPQGLPRVEVTFQLTRAADPSALDADELRQGLGLERTVEVHPDTERGIQGAFLGAVRSGVRRADVLRESNRLEAGAPGVTTGAQLLQQLQLGATASSTAASSSAPAEPAAKSVGRRPAVLPMTAYLAMMAEQEAASEAGVGEAISPSESPAPRRGGRRAKEGARPAVMPMSDWLRLSAANRPEESAPEPRPAAGLSDGLESDFAPVGKAVAGKALISKPPTGRTSAVGQVMVGRVTPPLGTPMQQVRTERAPVSLGRSTPIPVARAPAEPDPLGGTLVPMEEDQAERARTGGTLVPIERERVAPGPAERGSGDLSSVGPPTPWTPESAWDLVEAWPPTAWVRIVDAARAKGPSDDWASVGRGWQARASPMIERQTFPRKEYDRLVAWMAEAGESTSRNRCVALTTVAAHGRWCVIQLVQRAPTLDGMVRAAFDPLLPSKRVIHLLAQAAESYLLAAAEFQRNQVQLPVRLNTITSLEGRSLYADFLPGRPVEPPDEPPLVRLDRELRAIMGSDRPLSLSIGPLMDELDRMVKARPHLFPVVSVLQNLILED